MFAIKVAAEGGLEVVDYPANDSYNFLKAGVGGWIEAVDFDYPFPGTLWLNEEGKVHGLPFNGFATYLVRPHLFRNDYIVGLSTGYVSVL